MLVVACIVVALAVSGTSAQSICHSNHAQQTEDEVIQWVASEMDYDLDDVVELWELVTYFDFLLGRHMVTPDVREWMRNLTDDELIDEINAVDIGTPISKHDFTQAWHSRYHDSMAFIESAFDFLIDVDDDGYLDPDEIYKLRDNARSNYDANGDGMVQKVELEALLESIYKSENCIAANH